MAVSSLFRHSAGDEHLGSFQVWAFPNINVFVFSLHIFPHFCWVLVKILGHKARLCLVLVNTAKPFSKELLLDDKDDTPTSVV